MLELRTSCENCNKTLTYDSTEAVICAFECTFCKDCAENVLHEVCPNCGGNFSARPLRPTNLLEKYSVSKKVIYQPVNEETHLKKWKIK